MQGQSEVGATFTTTRTRPTVVAVIMTLFALALVPHEFSYTRETLAAELFVHVLCLLFLYFAVRSWRLVLRRPAELRLTPAALTVRRGDRELTVPWTAVGQIWIDGGFHSPWVVAWLVPSQDPADAPVSRRRDGAYKLFPVAHEQSVKKRGNKLREVRAAIMGYGRRYLDVN